MNQSDFIQRAQGFLQVRADSPAGKRARKYIEASAKAWTALVLIPPQLALRGTEPAEIVRRVREAHEAVKAAQKTWTGAAAEAAAKALADGAISALTSLGVPAEVVVQLKGVFGGSDD